MSSFLDSIVPERRRERRRQVEGQLDTRWGDPYITAPNQLYYQDPSLQQDQANQEIDSQQIGGNDGDSERQMASVTLTIPLPWYKTKKTDKKSSTFNSEPTADPSYDFTNANRIQSSQKTTPPIVVYKPASESYRKELDESLSPHPGFSSAPVIYKPASDDYKKEMDELANLTGKRPGSSRNGLYSEHEGPFNTVNWPPYDRWHTTPSSNIVSYQSSPLITQESRPSTPGTDFSEPEEIVNQMAELGLSPEPKTWQSLSRSPSITSSHRTSFSMSTSPSFSSDGEFGPVKNPKGLQNATMSTGGPYEPIIKTNHDDILSRRARIPRREGSTQSTTSPRLRLASFEQTVRADGRSSSVDRHPIRSGEQSRITAGSRAQLRGQGQVQSQTPPIDHASKVARKDSGKPKSRGKDVLRRMSLALPRSTAESSSHIPQQMVPEDEDLWG